MESQTHVLDTHKISQTVEKYVELISQDKIYQFTQKIQLLAHRKEQSKKFEQAEYLLFCGIQKLLSLTSEDKLEGYSLFDHLLKIYPHHLEIWGLEKGKKVFDLLNIRKNEKRFEYYVKFLKTLKNSPFPKELLMDLVNYYVSKSQFTKAESHIFELQTSVIRNFLEKWKLKVSQQQGTAIQCRLALLKGLFSNFEDSYLLLQDVNNQSPFFKFTKFLISASKLKSREAYTLIGARYKEFLERDPMYYKIYLGYGSYFFKIDNSTQGNGLLSLFN